MASKLLTKQNLRKIYKACSYLPPFNEMRGMPQPHKIQFSVIDTNEVMGYFHTEPMRIEIDKMCDTWDKIFVTMLHECCHVYLYHNGYEDFDQHEDRFKRLAKRVCDVYIGIDLEDF